MSVHHEDTQPNLMTVGSVEGCDVQGERADALAQQLGDGWDVYCVRNDGCSVVLYNENIAYASSKQLSDVEAKCMQTDTNIVHASATINAYDQCMYVEARWRQQQHSRSWPPLAKLAMCILIIRIVMLWMEM